jgi:hypothetical protein
MVYNIIVPREFQAEYEDVLAEITGEGVEGAGFGDFLGIGFDNTFSQMFGGLSEPPEITQEIFNQLKTKFGFLMTGPNEYKIMYVRNNN